MDSPRTCVCGQCKDPHSTPPFFVVTAHSKEKIERLQLPDECRVKHGMSGVVGMCVG